MGAGAHPPGLHLLIKSCSRDPGPTLLPAFPVAHLLFSFDSDTLSCPTKLPLA